MKTLIIHLDFPGTEFLSEVYSGLKECTVLRKDVPRHNVVKLIEANDRVILMGHGDHNGLYGVNRGKFNDLIIDESFVELLKEKKQLICIWCYASDFVRKHDLDCFCSGMFVSDSQEAVLFQLDSFENINSAELYERVEDSNYTFSRILAKALDNSLDDMYTKVVEGYSEIAKTNNIAKYNHERLHRNG
jgi:hypothetical protein